MADAKSAEQQQAATTAEVGDFQSLLKKEFRPKTDRAREQVEAAVKTLAEQVLQDKDLIADDAVNSINAIIAEIDKKLTDQINLVLHHADFQQMEGSWRGLRHLVFNTESSETLKIKIFNVSKKELGKSLKENRDHLAFLLNSAFHKTVDLKAMSENGLPGELVDDMVALRIHGREPVTMRYFKIKEDGTLDYVIDHVANVEITFRKPGGALQTYRHVSADLSDGGLKHNPGLMAYMKARAPFTAMTKASSFLLWEPYFSTIRNFLLENMVFMISDATGPLPEHAKKAGFEQIPYGEFSGPEVAFPNLKHKEEMIDLWAKSEKRPSPIRYGYSDAKRRGHLLITKKKAP